MSNYTTYDTNKTRHAKLYKGRKQTVKRAADNKRRQVYESPRPSSYAPTCGQSVPKCGHTPGKVAGQQATVKAEMNGFTPGLDRRPPFR